ncbi:hypothetical protein [Neobacillus sp. D3-1R]|uniref:hypothetical protein n=1 Tax=Neobacillus sp. D3-1R TaxID=3445778 RepID=UPI003FA192D2
MNRVGKYAISKDMDEIQLMNMVFELPEKDRMLMWLQGYMDQVIEKLPEYAKSILEEQKAKWEDTMEYVRNQLDQIVNQTDFIKATKAERKEFALFVMKKYPQYQSLLFRYYDKNLKDIDLKRFVYNRRFGPKKFLS